MDPGYCEIYSTSAAFILHKENSSEVLVIDRSISTITKKKNEQFLQGHAKKFFGVLGILQLQASNYLILITQASHVARIKDHFIYIIKEIEFLSYSAVIPESAEAKSDLKTMDLLKSFILSDTFYFAYDYDLTLSVQKIASLTGPQKSQSKWERSDKRFFWNQYLCEGLIKAEAHEHILTVVNGLVKGEYVSIGSKSFDYILISRRDKRRNGTRFNTRGLDEYGNAVNFVETEQICAYWEDNAFTLMAHVQIRGSIPLIWQQKPNISWMPRPKISNSTQQNISAAELHFNELYQTYGGVSLVNLIDKKGSQKTIGTVFTNLVETQNNKLLKYIWFDFHHECKNMKYENLRVLIRDLVNDLVDFSWCEVKIGSSEYIDKGQLLKRQTGVFRTNCMDCLDRTNVVQSVLARNVLLQQLASIGKGPNPTGEAFQAFQGELETAFRDLWVQNADAMSILYSGTPAQKTDFTKLGKRTIKGAMMDSKYGLQRYVINNFLDGTKQNTMDLFLGKVSVKSGPNFSSKYKPLLVFLTTLALIFIISATAASKAEGNSYWMLWTISFLLLTNLLKSYGSSFTDKPIISSN